MTEITTINLGFVNCFLVKTDTGYFLIDTGMAGHRRKVEAALERAGCRSGDLKLILITHGDMDHIGSAAHLRKAYGAKIALHRADEPMVSSSVGRIAGMARKSGRGAMLKLGFKLMGLVMKIPAVRKRITAGLFAPDVLLGDGDDLGSYGLPARVLHLPGHTPGSIGILLDSGDIFVGDLIRSTRKAILSPLGEDFGLMAAQFKRLLDMKITKVYPGHGRVFPVGELLRHGDEGNHG